MKKVLSLVAAAGILAAASTSFALVQGGKHDMRIGSSAVITGVKAAAGTQICVYCHAPHGAYSALPLWNRNASTNAASFKLYSNVGMANKIYGTGFTTDSTSLFCMSCHDGATNINAIKNVPPVGTLTAGFVGGDGNLGLDLSNSTANTGHVTHPINFPVLNTTTQNDLWPVANGEMGDAASLSGLKLPLFPSSRTADTTTRNSLECSSCHSVHNYDNSPFLRGTMAGSALCLGCHNK